MTLEELGVGEQEAVEELKRRMTGHMDEQLYKDDPTIFQRFLIARNFNMNAAEAMLRNHIEWRKINQVDTILTDYTPKEVIKKYFTLDTMGFDKEGSPILYYNVGNLDTRGLLKSARKVDAMKAIIQKLESNIQAMKEQSKKLGKRVDKWIQVLNFENLPFSTATHKPTLEIIGGLITMYEANYPERLKAGYLINASIYFSIAFAVVKPFVSGPTFRKLKIFGKDGWKEELLKHIDADVLPAFLGGNKTDPDGNPLCKTFISQCGLVPEHYYIDKHSKTLANQPGVKKLTISRMSKAYMPLNVTESGSCIEWEFETKSRDIGFALLFKASKDSDIVELIPKQRIDTLLSSETGLFHCKNPGIYIIEFDNSYSWVHHKEVYCRTVVAKDDLPKQIIMD